MRHGFYPGMPAAGYHADPCVSPSLNYSTAKALINESAWHAWRQHPRLGGSNRVTTPGMDKGTLVHALLLGQPVEHVEVLKFDNYKKKAAQEQRDAAKEVGRFVILEREYDALTSGVPTMRKNIEDAGIVLNGLCELTALWEVDGVECRTRFDNVTEDFSLVVDLKCTDNANPKLVERHIIDMCYDIQAAAEIEAIETLKPEQVGRVRFADVFIELEHPYFVVVAEHAESMLDHGKSRWNRARKTWKRCIDSNEWAGFTNHVLVHAPNWAINKEFGEVA